jgi:hypothetical protein
MQTVNCVVAIGGDQGNTVPKFGITIAEVAVLRAIHGPDAIIDIELAGDVERGNRDERLRLLKEYVARDEDGKLIVENLFPGVGAKVPEDLEDLGLPEELMKPLERASQKPAKRGKAQAEAGILG